MAQEWKDHRISADNYLPGIGQQYYIEKEMIDPKVFEEINAGNETSEIGNALMTATDASSAREIIGAGTPYTLPAATTDTIGGVKKASITPLVAASDATAVEAADAEAAAADTPTKAEFDAVVTELNEVKADYNEARNLINELKEKLNSVINEQRASGQAADS